jgi:hypothetical protein
LTAKSSNLCKLDELQRQLAEAQKQASKIAELILDDNAKQNPNTGVIAFFDRATKRA